MSDPGRDALIDYFFEAAMPSLIPFFYPGRVALIDFGLMAQMDRGHQEAMASGVLNIMAGNYEALVDIFKEMGVLDSSRADLRR